MSIRRARRVHPPSLAKAILKRVVPEAHRRTLLADLDEDFQARVREHGRLAARAWYWLEIARCRPILWYRRARSTSTQPRPRPRKRLLSAIALDVRFALRHFRRHPGFVTAATLTLAFAIGANVAVFSVIDHVLLEDLPYRDPDRLVVVWNSLPASDVPRAAVSGPDFLDYRNQTTAFEALAGVWIGRTTLTGGDRAEQVTEAKVTENFFDVLGVRTALGRGFRDGEGTSMDFTRLFDPNQEVAAGAILLSDGIFQRGFGRDPGIVNRTVRIDGGSVRVLGVLPDSFQLLLPAALNAPSQVDVWAAFRSSDLSTNPREARWITVIGRLRPGVTMAQAQEQMDAVAARHRAQFQGHARARAEIVVVPLHADVVQSARPILSILMGSVTVVFLIACANVAALLLVRGFNRRSEIAVRCALGASRGRIVRQFLTESVLLASMGSVIGVLVAHQGIGALLTLQPGILPGVRDVTLDLPLLGVTVGLAALATLLFGLMPALQVTRVAEALRERHRTEDVGGRRIRSALIVSEVALSVMLLFGASLLTKTLLTLQRVDLGFDPHNVVTAAIAVPQFDYPTADTRAAFFQQLTARIAEMRGAEVAGGIASPPLSNTGGVGPSAFLLEGEEPERWQSNRVTYVAMLPGFFSALRVPVRAGRVLGLSDMRPNAPPVVVVDEAFAQRAWPGQGAVGRRLQVSQFDAGERAFRQVWVEVVGVVGNVRHLSLRSESSGAVYATTEVWPWQEEFAVVARSRQGADIVVDEIRSIIGSLNSSIPVADALTQESFIRAAMGPSRFMVAIVSVFAVGAVLLAAVGLYAVVAFFVRLQTREIGIRIAFGARPGAVRALVVRRGLLLGIVGTALGAAGGMALGGFLGNQLVEVRARDPLALLVVCVTMLGISIAASYVPASRASRIEPVEALGTE